jgi:hypothetical protein
MTFGKMRELGGRGLMVHCLNPKCLHQERLDVDAMVRATHGPVVRATHGPVRTDRRRCAPELKRATAVRV